MRSNGEVDVLVSPASPMPRKNLSRRSRLVEEHRRRLGDPVEGGGSRKPIMTAPIGSAPSLAQPRWRKARYVPGTLRQPYHTRPRSCTAMSMDGSSRSSGESIPWPSLAEPRFCGGRSPRRRLQSINDVFGSGENGSQSASCDRQTAHATPQFQSRRLALPASLNRPRPSAGELAIPC